MTYNVFGGTLSLTQSINLVTIIISSSSTVTVVTASWWDRCVHTFIVIK